jgi:hypothetical protein
MWSAAIVIVSEMRASRSLPRGLLLVGSLGLLISLSGCGEKSQGDRVPLSGSVTVDGKPLDVKATLAFDPEPGQTGTGSMCEVQESKYTADVTNGPTPGQKYNVTLLTSPGIPKEGTPPDQIKQPLRYTTKVEVPKLGLEEAALNIDFPSHGK